MKIQILTFLLLFIAVGVVAQEEPMKMKPEMTEIWDPEITVITPGETPADAQPLPCADPAPAGFD